MTSKRILLDTNAVSDVMNGFEQILDVLRNYDEYAVPSIVLGELYFMAENSARRIENYSRVEAFLQGIAILDVTADTARYYARVRLELKRKGRPIPLHDYWIAALALQHGLPLLTRDSDFLGVVSGLHVVTWNSPFPPQA